ncbi:hypothetical protein [Burkholderia latens]|nr:hypothetical protein [Burkholderia latens]
MLAVKENQSALPGRTRHALDALDAIERVPQVYQDYTTEHQEIDKD